MEKFRTDMALEVAAPKTKMRVKRVIEGVTRTDVTLSHNDAKVLGREGGRFITIESDITNPERAKATAQQLCKGLDELMKKQNVNKSGEILVVGLGNRGMTADSLGHRVAQNLIVTRHLEREIDGFGRLCAICPSVLGVTGVESFSVIAGVVSQIEPACVIAVDTLASRKTERLASAFQLTDTGITPGSGVDNSRITLCQKSLGVPVIAAGVPLVVYASTIINDVAQGAIKNEDIRQAVGDLVVTPKDIDLIVATCAHILALGINLCVHNASHNKIAALMLKQSALL